MPCKSHNYTLRDGEQMTKNSAVIVAGGKGTRMNSSISKQFLELKGKPIICHTLEAFCTSSLIDEIVLVLPEKEILTFKEDILPLYPHLKDVIITAGGSRRQDSVYNGLRTLRDCDIVLIHDGARPFVTEEIINQGIEYASLYGACACGVTPKDTIKIKDEHNFSELTPEREHLFAVQTPQCFKLPLIMKAHEELVKNQRTVTDDTMAVEYLGERVYLYAGDYRNIKITTPEDLIIAETLLDNKI